MNCSLIGTVIKDLILGRWYKCTRCKKGGWGGIEDKLPAIVCDDPSEIIIAITDFKQLPCCYRNRIVQEKVVSSCCDGNTTYETLANCRLLDRAVRLNDCICCDSIKP